MGTWYYRPQSPRQFPCQEELEDAELAIGSCCEEGAEIVVRHPVSELGGEDVIASLHLPTEDVLEAVEALLRYSGVGVADAIAHLQQVQAEQQSARRRLSHVSPRMRATLAREMPYCAAAFRWLMPPADCRRNRGLLFVGEADLLARPPTTQDLYPYPLDRGVPHAKLNGHLAVG